MYPAARQCSWILKPWVIYRKGGLLLKLFGVLYQRAPRNCKLRLFASWNHCFFCLFLLSENSKTREGAHWSCCVEMMQRDFIFCAQLKFQSWLHAQIKVKVLKNGLCPLCTHHLFAEIPTPSPPPRPSVLFFQYRIKAGHRATIICPSQISKAESDVHLNDIRGWHKIAGDTRVDLLSESSQHRHITKKGELRFSKFGAEDVGTYECSVYKRRYGHIYSDLYDEYSLRVELKG